VHVIPKRSEGPASNAIMFGGCNGKETRTDFSHDVAILSKTHKSVIPKRSEGPASNAIMFGGCNGKET
jgi:hypothetical protein